MTRVAYRGYHLGGRPSRAVAAARGTIVGAFGAKQPHGGYDHYWVKWDHWGHGPTPHPWSTLTLVSSLPPDRPS